MPENNNKSSRRDAIKKGGKLALAATGIGLAGCSDTSGTNDNGGNNSSTGDGGDGTGTGQQDPETGVEPEFEYREFMDRASIDPSYITEQVNDDIVLEDFVKTDPFTYLEVENTQSMFDALDNEHAEIVNQNAVEGAPWHIFGVKPGDVAARANDLDFTQTMLFNVPVEDIKSNVMSGDLEKIDEGDDYLKFGGEFTSERTEKSQVIDSVYAVGYVQDTDMGPGGILTREIPYPGLRFTDSRDQVGYVADLHHELLDGDRDPITANDEIGDLAAFIFNRATESDGTLARIYGKPESEATETSYFYEEDGFEYTNNNIVRSGSGFESEAKGGGKLDITELSYVNDPDSQE